MAEAINGFDYKLLNNMGTVYKKLKDYHKAGLCYFQSMYLQPQGYAAYFNLGLFFQEQNDLPKAI